MKKAIELIKKFEGLKLNSYLCPAGVWTVGYGHTGTDVKKGLTITPERAEELLQLDLIKFDNFLDRVVKSKVNENQRAALLSFMFNVGQGSFLKSTLLKKVNLNPNDESIGAEFKKWVYANGKILPGLIIRREAEKNLYYEKLVS